MKSRFSRRALVASFAVSALLPGAAFAADTLKEIHIDWATYNPVSIILKQKGLLEKEFAKDGIKIVWVQSAGSNKALEFLIDGRFGRPPRQDQRQSDQGRLRLFPAGMDRAGYDQGLKNR